MLRCPASSRPSRRLVGPGTSVVGADDDLATRMAADLAAALDVEPRTSGDWSGQAPGEGADDRVRTAYHSLSASGGTVVAVTSRRGVLSVLADVLGTPVERFWAARDGAGQPHRGRGLGGRVRVGGFHQSDRPSRLTDAVRYSGHELCR